MELRLVAKLGRRLSGTTITRYRFFNTDTTNYMTKAHSYFTRAERKEAKAADKFLNS